MRVLGFVGVIVFAMSASLLTQPLAFERCGQVLMGDGKVRMNPERMPVPTRSAFQGGEMRDNRASNHPTCVSGGFHELSVGLAGDPHIGRDPAGQASAEERRARRQTPEIRISSYSISALPADVCATPTQFAY
ncbi:hypothetical protein [Paraburkholderia oxyphila]|uniref:hypothetical protein n=1 Tax=Paraburkholderia oxyphila TaxID=614212 RepID=UPI00047F0C65|nr:hypothetical protein [Paraburkholderia oxyphila]